MNLSFGVYYRDVFLPVHVSSNHTPRYRDIKFGRMTYHVEGNLGFNWPATHRVEPGGNCVCRASCQTIWLYELPNLAWQPTVMGNFGVDLHPPRGWAVPQQSWVPAVGHKVTIKTDMFVRLCQKMNFFFSKRISSYCLQSFNGQFPGNLGKAEPGR